MTAQELASMLEGHPIWKSIPKNIEKLAKENKLVIVKGYSDDVCHFSGFSKQGDVSSFNGAIIIILSSGRAENQRFIQDLFYENPQELIDFINSYHKGNYIYAMWCENDYAWSFETDIECVKFDFKQPEGEALKQQGIVFSIEDLVRY